jgi:hypothetical protein
MTVMADAGPDVDSFTLEDISTGVFASGFGQLGDGRSFSFRMDGPAGRQALLIEIYRQRLAGPVPHDEDVVASARRPVLGIDLADERSLAAAVRDGVNSAVPAAR